MLQSHFRLAVPDTETSLSQSPEPVCPFLGDFIPAGSRYFYNQHRQCYGNWGRMHVLPTSEETSVQAAHAQGVSGQKASLASARLLAPGAAMQGRRERQRSVQVSGLGNRKEIFSLPLLLALAGFLQACAALTF